MKWHGGGLVEICSGSYLKNARNMADAALAPILEKRDKAKESLAQLKTEINKLEEDVEAVELLAKEDGNEPAVEKKCAELNERITQSTIKVDGVEVSRSLAADALKAGNRTIAKELAVLLMRRKSCVKSLLDLGSRIEGVEQKTRQKKSAAGAASGSTMVPS